MRLIIYGPQGSGKSTQAKLLATKLNIPAISAGEISRQIATEDSEEGRLVKKLIDSGNPAPNEIINPRLEKILSSPEASHGYVLDGFPRYDNQLELLQDYLNRANTTIDRVILINLPLAEGVKRIMSRTKIEGRDDDTPDGIARRLELFKEQTAPIITKFRQEGKLLEIDGSGSIEEVHKNILLVLKLV